MSIKSFLITLSIEMNDLIIIDGLIFQTSPDFYLEISFFLPTRAGQ